MTISPAIIESIQRAGAAVFTAHAEVHSASLEQGHLVAQAISTNPFGLENDGLIESWKALSRLAQELQDLDKRLRAVHGAASSLVSNNAIVVSELPRLSASAPKADKPGRKPRSVKVVKAARLAKEAGAVKPAKPPRPLRGNDAKVHGFLNQVLVRESFKPVRQVEIALGAAIPLGSVARSVSQLLARGLLHEGSKGSYRLA